MNSLLPATESASQRYRGILLMIAAIFCFISLDATMKYLMQSYSLIQVTWSRFFFGTIFALGLARRNLPKLFISRVPYKQSLRSFLMVSISFLFNAGIRTVPLPTATTIMFLTPIMVTFLSVPLLKEHVGLRRWIGIIVGFLGALIVTRPWNSLGSSLGFGMVLVFLAALANANYQIITRMVRMDHPLTSLLFTSAGGAIVMSLFLPWFWQTPDLKGWGLLIFTGVIGNLGHLFLIKAFQIAPASLLAPYSYTALIWATLFGFLLWGDWPDGWTWIGASLIIGSGLYIFYRERQLNRRQAKLT